MRYLKNSSALILLILSSFISALFIIIFALLLLFKIFSKAEGGGGILLIIGAFFIVPLAVFGITTLLFYVIKSLALMCIAQELGYKRTWMAWIPIGDLFLLVIIVKQPWWPIMIFLASLGITFFQGLLTFLIIGLPILEKESIIFLMPILKVLGTVFSLVSLFFFLKWIWLLCELRNRPGWWAIIPAIPIVNFLLFPWLIILFYVLAWTKNPEET